MSGFGLLFAADWFRLRGKRKASSILGWAGYAALSLFFVHEALSPGPSWPFAATDASPPLGLEGAPMLLLSVTAVISCALLLWSVFFEFLWVRKRRGLDPGELVDSGTYRFCRHPGFWWFALFAFSLAALRGHVEYFIAASLATGLDFLLIFVQDRFVFPRLFVGYDTYRDMVPFLIPKLRKSDPGPGSR